MQTIRDEWHAMSPEEKTTAVTDRVEDLKEKRVERTTAPVNSSIGAFHDAAGNLRVIVDDVSVHNTYSNNNH